MPAFGNKKLNTFARLVPQPLQGWPGRLGEAEAALPGEPAQLDEAPTEAVRAPGVLFDQPIRRQGRRQTVRRGPREARALNEPGKAQGPSRGQAIEDANGLAE
jgi:hypothetical protein